MTMNLHEAIMWAILERCGGSPEGHLLDVAHPIVSMLLEVGVLKPGEGGFTVLTETGQALLKQMPEVPKNASVKRRRLAPYRRSAARSALRGD